IDVLNIFRQGLGNSNEILFRTSCLQLYHVKNELVRPGYRTAHEIAVVIAGLTLDQFISDRFDAERRSVHDHILQLNTIGLEEVNARRLKHYRLVLILLRKTSMITEYSLSFNTLSSVPASMFGLSFTSMT